MDDHQTHTDHIRRRQEFDGIVDPAEIRDLIDNAALDEVSAQILSLRYLKRKSFGYIADTLGYSYQTIICRHGKALERVLAYRHIKFQSL